MTCDGPATLRSAGPARARELADAASPSERGREVFAQAEAVFGSAEVTRAEFASRLHFAATVLGRRAYADQLAAAEPGLPWRTVRAWWRPAAPTTVRGKRPRRLTGTRRRPPTPRPRPWTRPGWTPPSAPA
ncbi:hypothetical protein ABZY31_22825 [Streptomyces sp. NPDC006529]|uniref:hypothetical protein n=1 Tax=Streptomyces sp. NPDC006529 TaxID=3157177 RepID=UPI00339EA7C8